eukprot:6465862-Amphidinium_carterae.1
MKLGCVVCADQPCFLSHITGFPNVLAFAGMGLAPPFSQQLFKSSDSSHTVTHCQANTQKKTKVRLQRARCLSFKSPLEDSSSATLLLSFICKAIDAVLVSSGLLHG